MTMILPLAPQRLPAGTCSGTLVGDACHGTLCLLSDTCEGTADLEIDALGEELAGSLRCSFSGGLSGEGVQLGEVAGTISHSGAASGTCGRRILRGPPVLGRDESRTDMPPKKTDALRWSALRRARACCSQAVGFEECPPGP